VRELLRQLHIQRMDDHRYYHHSRINQSLHLLSASSFVVAYGLLFSHPAVAGLLAWLVSMTSRQAGHFFFEPKGYDHVNQATHEHKEEIKIGYNLRRKVVLMLLWAISPFILYWNPTLFGLIEPAVGAVEFTRQIGLLWLVIGLGGLIFRVLQLFVIRDAKTSLVWALKIITDPFHDIKLYYKSPLYLMRGQLIDPMMHTHTHIHVHTRAQTQRHG
jgi:hypothetical protein